MRHSALALELAGAPVCSALDAFIVTTSFMIDASDRDPWNRSRI
jgi:hypothetical protein